MTSRPPDLSAATFASTPTHDGQRRTAAYSCAVGLVLTLALLPFARVAAPPVASFFLINQTLLIVAYALSAWVLAGQYRRAPGPPLLVMTAGTLYTALIILLQLLSLPGIAGPGRLLGHGPETTTWLWTFWHLGPPVCAVVYAMAPRQGSTSGQWSGHRSIGLPIAFGLAIVAAALAAAAATVGLRWLPHQVTGDDYSALTTSGIGPIVYVLTAGALALVWFRTTRHRSVLELWIAVSLVFLLLDSTLTLVGSARGTVGWYVGRLEALFSAFVILLSYLHEVEALRTRSERIGAEVLQAEAALRQSQRMEAIGRLTGGVAHDFNNLLMIVGSSFEMIKRRADDRERVLRSADAGLEAVQRGARLTRQLLTFSRRHALNPETLNLNASLLEFEQLARRALGEAVTFEMSLDPALHPALVDRTEFESAILNLVVNARDAVSSLGGKVRVTTRNARLTSAPSAPELENLGAGDYVLVSVADDGAGMDAATIAQAFEPFFTTKEFGRGSGLGLSQVYGFVQAAGGAVKIASAPGHGTTMEIWLPRKERHAPAQAVQGPAAQLRRAACGETVLAVEDEPAVLAAVAENLRDLGYRVLTASNAVEALDRLRGEERIDVLFSDVVMPGGMNGVQLAVETARIRPDMRVLLTSGYADEALSAHRVPATMPVLTKPYGREELAIRLAARS